MSEQIVEGVGEARVDLRKLFGQPNNQLGAKIVRVHVVRKDEHGNIKSVLEEKGADGDNR